MKIVKRNYEKIQMIKIFKLINIFKKKQFVAVVRRMHVRMHMSFADQTSFTMAYIKQKQKV